MQLPPVMKINVAFVAPAASASSNNYGAACNSRWRPLQHKKGYNFLGLVHYLCWYLPTLSLSMGQGHSPRPIHGPPMLVQTLSRLCPKFLHTLSKVCPDCVQSLSRLCPGFIQIQTLSKSGLCPNPEFVHRPGLQPAALSSFMAHQCLSRQCPEFVQTMSRVNPNPESNVYLMFVQPCVNNSWHRQSGQNWDKPWMWMSNLCPCSGGLERHLTDFVLILDSWTDIWQTLYFSWTAKHILYFYWTYTVLGQTLDRC